MWLPKKQRELLLFYYHKLGEQFGAKLDLDKPVLIDTMKLLKSNLKEGQKFPAELEIMESPIYKKVKDAQGYLVDRGLVVLDYSSNGMKQDTYGQPHYIMKCVNLTTEGCDLARKYNNWFTRWGLWWEEHKVNPVWIILGYLVSFVLGVLAAFIVKNHIE